MLRQIQTSHAPAAIGPYSQAVVHGGLVYCSGSLGVVPSTGQFIAGGIEEQEQSLSNMSNVLKAADSGIEKVIKTTLFLKNMSDFSKVNQIYEKHFPLKPARSTVEVSRLPRDALFEIECIAYI